MKYLLNAQRKCLSNKESTLVFLNQIPFEYILF